MKKKLVSGFMIGFASMVLVACGSSEKSESASMDTYEKVMEEGELVIGTEGTYPPYTFHDESGKLTGFDVEIAQEVADRLGVKAKFAETQWDAMFAGLDAKRFDMVANQVGIRPDREEKYLFSKPYITSGAVLVTGKDASISSFSDIKGLTSAQSLTSNYRDIAQENGAEIVGVEGLAQAIELLASGRVDVTVNDKLSVLDYQQKQPNAPIKIAAEAEDASASGLLFRKDSELLVDKVNEALDEMKSDGTYEKISVKWFGENVSE